MAIPAMPIHSCRICSQMTSCTRRPVWSLPGANTKQHTEVALLVGCLLLEVVDVHDVLELGRGGLGLLAFLAAHTPEDVASLLLTADLDEPARRLGHDPDDA